MIKPWVDRLLDLPSRIYRRRSLNAAPRSTVRTRRIRYQPGCTVTVGEQSMVLARVLFDRPDGSLTVGARTFVGASTIVIAERIDIGDDVLIAWGCTIVDHDSHALRFDDRRRDVVDWLRGAKDWSHVEIKPVTIQDKVWIGLNAIIVKGVTLGEGSVVAAGSVVTSDVPPYALVAGNPARVVRELER
ncbi:MAG: acyltransferase [Candidatus Limnocylindrales bacterium]